MKDLDKKSNNELLVLKKETKDKFEAYRFEVVKVYDYWLYLGERYNKIEKEINNRGI